MPEVSFTNREITAMFEKQNTMLDSINKSVQRIETKVDKNIEDTQKRLTTLELKNADREGSMSIVKWIGISISLLVFGYLAWIGNQILHISNTVAQYQTVEVAP